MGWTLRSRKTESQSTETEMKSFSSIAKSKSRGMIELRRNVRSFLVLQKGMLCYGREISLLHAMEEKFHSTHYFNEANNHSV